MHGVGVAVAGGAVGVAVAGGGVAVGVEVPVIVMEPLVWLGATVCKSALIKRKLSVGGAHVIGEVAPTVLLTLTILNS